jgi:glutathionylspermidine synthase
MQRIASQPRADWQQRVESQGLVYHSADGVPYWDEGAYYRLTADQVDELERATYELDRMCLVAVQHVIDERLFELLQIPEAFVEFIVDSWQRDEFTLYGRFDLAYDGVGPPKLLEYNADTPTSLLEAAVIQWTWLQDCHFRADQFNSLHERLIEAWGALADTRDVPPGTLMTFTALADHPEDVMNVSYLRDTAIQAGWRTQHVRLEDVGWDVRQNRFVDAQGRPIDWAFKLYPWEWMVREEFGPHLLTSGTRWLEPPWKMLLSNKAILPVLWGLFPDSPYLLPASFEPLAGDHVRKPRLSREGANIGVSRGGAVVLETGGDYEGPYVYQQYRELPNFDGNYPVVGSWMVNGYACGIGIREDASPVTCNTSRFVPHLFE